jgi:cell wall-associated NlpC family hydrolase
MYKDIATKIAMSFLGKPYVWGGDDPIAGFDCSGFAIEILKSVGRLPMDGDWTAKGLYERWKENEVSYPQEGCLVFWGRTKEGITHVEYCLNEDLSIGARSGGRKTKTLKDAIDQNAYIMIRPIRSRLPLVFVDPFMKGK